MQCGGQNHAVEESVGESSGNRHGGPEPRLSWGAARKGGGSCGGSSSNVLRAVWRLQR